MLHCPAGTVPSCPQGKARQSKAKQGKARQGAHSEWQGWGCLSAERPRRGPLGFPAKAGRSSPAARAWLLLAWQLGGESQAQGKTGSVCVHRGLQTPSPPAFPQLGGGEAGGGEIRN